MPDFRIYAGDTSQTVYFRLRDSTTGLAKTGLVFDSTGATCSFTLPGAARVAITLATLASASASWATGGFILVDDTNCKGLYRLDLPNAAIASGKYTVISIEFDGIIEESMLIPLEIPDVNSIEFAGTTIPVPNTAGIIDVNVREWLDVAVTLSTGNKPDVNVDEWANVLLATTNPLPNAVPGAAGGVFIAGTNAATVVTTSFTTTFTGNVTGSVDSVTNAVGSVTGAVGSVTGAVGSVAGNVDGSVASVTGDVGITATAVNLIWNEAMVETTGAPAITGSMRLFMSWWAALSRNEIHQTATLTTLRNDADDGDLSTSIVSDDATTFIRQEFST